MLGSVLKSKVAFRLALVGIVAGVSCLRPCLSVAQGPGSLPFNQTYRRPNVSAYQQLNNFAMNPQQQTALYQQFVQPLQQQQATLIEQMSMSQRLGDVQQQVSTLSTSSQSRVLDATIRPTGHASTYLNMSHFYPASRR